MVGADFPPALKWAELFMGRVLAHRVSGETSSSRGGATPLELSPAPAFYLAGSPAARNTPFPLKNRSSNRFSASPRAFSIRLNQIAARKNDFSMPSGLPMMPSEPPPALSESPMVLSEQRTALAESRTVPSEPWMVPSELWTVLVESWMVPSELPMMPSELPTAPSDHWFMRYLPIKDRFYPQTARSSFSL